MLQSLRGFEEKNRVFWPLLPPNSSATPIAASTTRWVADTFAALSFSPWQGLPKKGNRQDTLEEIALLQPHEFSAIKLRTLSLCNCWLNVSSKGIGAHARLPTLVNGLGTI